ncbi:hypothetical protein V8C44DRAFT_338043 [Trichoderma aethiopicum]
MTTMSHTRTKSLRYLLILSTTWCNQPVKPTYHPPWYLRVYLTPLCFQLISTCSTRPSCVRDTGDMSLQDGNNDVLRKHLVTRLSQILPYHSNACMGSPCCLVGTLSNNPPWHRSEVPDFLDFPPSIRRRHLRPTGDIVKT